MFNNTFVSEYLSSDHRRLDLILNSLIKALKENKSLELSQSLFYLFKSGLLRHIHWEESVLFPIFEGETKMTQGPTMVMKTEHAQMNAVLSSIEETLDNSIDLEKIIALGNCLNAHNKKEESILYPAIDRLLDHDAQELIAVAISREFK